MNYVEVVNQNQHMQGFSSGNGFMYWSFTKYKFAFGA